jgi:diacylglycerol kinase (ATP)
MKNQINRFTNAFRGILHAIRNDSNFSWQIISIIFFILIGYIARPITSTEILFLVLSYFLILITELQNTSIEAALDRIHPEHHRDIGKSKDMMAGSVLLAGLFALVVVLVILI